jgi:hypothetical protein
VFVAVLIGIGRNLTIEEPGDAPRPTRSA